MSGSGGRTGWCSAVNTAGPDSSLLSSFLSSGMSTTASCLPVTMLSAAFSTIFAVAHSTSGDGWISSPSLSKARSSNDTDSPLVACFNIDERITPPTISSSSLLDLLPSPSLPPSVLSWLLSTTSVCTVRPSDRMTTTCARLLLSGRLCDTSAEEHPTPTQFLMSSRLGLSCSDRCSAALASRWAAVGDEKENPLVLCLPIPSWPVVSWETTEDDGGGCAPM